MVEEDLVIKTYKSCQKVLISIAVNSIVLFVWKKLEGKKSHFCFAFTFTILLVFKLG